MGQQAGNWNGGNWGGGGQIGAALSGSGKLGNIAQALQARFGGGGAPGVPPAPGAAVPAVMPQQGPWGGGNFDMNALRAALQNAGPSIPGSAQDLRNPNARVGMGYGVPATAYGGPTSVGNVLSANQVPDGNWGSVSAPRPAQAATWPNGWGPQGDNRLAEAYGSPGTGALAPGSTRPSPQFAQSAGAPSGRNQIAVQGNPAARRALGY